METIVNLIDLFNSGEHPLYKNYVQHVDEGFKYLKIVVNTTTKTTVLKDNLLIFVLEGEVIVDYDKFKDRKFTKDCMILLPKSSAFSFRITENVKILAFIFNQPKNSYDKLLLSDLTKYTINVDYDFRPIKIHRSLSAFFKLLIYCLKNGVDCVHLNETLEHQLFSLLHGHYSREELAQLFYPIVCRDSDFVDFVLNNYKEVSNVNELVKLSNVGRSKFFDLFRQNFKCTVYQFMTEKKKELILEAACKPGITVKDLYYSFNFESASHFTYYIRKNFACSPKELISRCNECK
jgi:AraC-like DNA-binding protein